MFCMTKLTILKSS